MIEKNTEIEKRNSKSLREVISLRGDFCIGMSGGEFGLAGFYFYVDLWG